MCASQPDGLKPLDRLQMRLNGIGPKRPTVFNLYFYEARFGRIKCTFCSHMNEGTIKSVKHNSLATLVRWNYLIFKTYSGDFSEDETTCVDIREGISVTSIRMVETVIPFAKSQNICRGHHCPTQQKISITIIFTKGRQTK